MLHVSDRQPVLERRGRPLVLAVSPGKVRPTHDRVRLVEVVADKREVFAEAVVLGVHTMRVCDVPSYLVALHYHPDRRTHEGFTAHARDVGLKTRSSIDVVIFVVPETGA